MGKGLTFHSQLTCRRSKAPSVRTNPQPLTQSESHNTATAHAYMYFTPIHTFLTANELSSITIQFNIQLLINTSKYNRRAQVPCSPSPPSSAISFSSSKRQRCLQLITNSSRSKTEPTNEQIPSPSSHQVVLRTTS